MPLRLGQEIQAVPRQTRIVIQVAAGVLRNAAGEVLIAERLGDGPFTGLWEFPGGKISGDETAEGALRRELREELGIEVLSCAPFMNLSHAYDDRTVELAFFEVSDWRGDPAGIEGQQIRWVAVDHLNAAELLPADAPLVSALRESD
jgi:8-oxo-dGTP diphosphatase